MLVSATRDRPRAPEDLVDAALFARLDRLDLRTRKMFPGKLQGERRSKKRGQSVEFDDYRNYTSGDDLRFIDWNVYARLEKLFVKLFREEEDLALHICVDASASMDAGSPNKLGFACRAAMALAYIGLVQQNRVGMSVFGVPGMSGVALSPDARGRRHVRRMAQFLFDEAWGPRMTQGMIAGGAAPGAEFGGALSTIARRRVGRGVMVVISDFLIPDGYDAGLRALSAAGGAGGGGYDTYCIQVLSPGEAEPERERELGLAGDVRLLDVESGRSAEVTMTSALIRRYKERLDAHCERLMTFCRAREMNHVLVRTDADVSGFVLETLRRRGVVG